MSLLEKRKLKEKQSSDEKTIEELEEELAKLQSELARKTVVTKEKLKLKVIPKEKEDNIIEKKNDEQNRKLKQKKKIKQKKIDLKSEIVFDKPKPTKSQKRKVNDRPDIKIRKNIKKEDLLEIEAEFYSCIATLNSVVKNFEEGKLDPPTYKRQIRSLMRDAFKSQMELQEINYDMEGFLKNERIIEKFPFAAQKLRFTDKSTFEISPLDIATVSTAQIATMSSDLVSHFITISDYTKLDMAKISAIMPILDDIILIIEKFPGFGKEYWVYIAVNQWRDKISVVNPSEILNSEDNSKLEYDVVRWAQDFKRRLQDL